MAANSGRFEIEHSYILKHTERIPSLFPKATINHCNEHSYSAKRKRELSSPTGKTPKQLEKVALKNEVKTRKTLGWCSEEKVFLMKYVEETPRDVGTSLLEYWHKCANKVNMVFPDSCRNGNACKSLAQRLLIAPQTISSPETSSKENATSINTVDVATQTDFLAGPDLKDGDWIFLEPKKELQEGASRSAQLTHKVALKRLRQYASLSKAEKACLIDLIYNATPQQLARAMMGIKSLGGELRNIMLFDIEMEAQECANKGSALYLRNFDNMMKFKWETIINEMFEKQSFLAEVLLAVSLPRDKIGNNKRTESLVPVVGTTYGMLMKQRYQALSGVQKMITAALANEQTHQKVYDHLQPLGITLCHQGMLDTMASISGTFNSRLIDSLKLGKRFRIVGDNINFKMGVSQERKCVGKMGHIQHWFGSAAIVQNVNVQGMDNHVPRCDLCLLPTQTFIMSEEEWQQMSNNFSVLSARVLVEFFPCLKPCMTGVNEAIAVVPEDLKKKNVVIPLPIMHKNEQKYADVVDILDYYQQTCESVHLESGKVLEPVHIGGDQLTRDRFSGAKKLRAAALTSKERLESLNPVTFELFHLQIAVLTMFFQILYDEAHTDVFTLHSQKIRLLRKDANGLDVKNHFDSCKELAISVIKAYLVQATLEYYNLQSTKSSPENIPNLKEMLDQEKKEWMISFIKPIVSEVLSVSKKVVNGTFVEDENPDMVYSYSMVLVELGLVFLELCDIVKSPNRVRLITCLKYLMLILKGHNSRSKYALEILRFLCQQYALLSEKQAHAAAYGLFVNTGKSIIPADLQMEHLVRITKTHIRTMCSNVTEQSLIKRSSAFFGISEISAVLEKESLVIKRAQKHKRISSAEDEQQIMNDLKTVKIFEKIPGRHAESLNKHIKNPISKLLMEDLQKWIQKYQTKFVFEI